jgi:hypothetical protein
MQQNLLQAMNLKLHLVDNRCLGIVVVVVVHLILEGHFVNPNSVLLGKDGSDGIYEKLCCHLYHQIGHYL